MADIAANALPEKNTAAVTDDRVILVDSEDGMKVKQMPALNFEGPQGNPGTDGTNAEVTAGTTTTLPAGSSATVTNVGTPSNAIFDFGIPKGEDGTGNMNKSTYDTNNSGKVDDIDYLEKHGIAEGCEFSVNSGDSKLYDVAPGIYYINGIKYEFAGVTAQAGLGGAKDFEALGFNNAGLTAKLNSFFTLAESEDQLEVTVFARDASSNITIFGNSQFDVNTAIKELYHRAKFFEGTQFKNGAGTISASSTSMQVDRAAGTVNAPNLENVEITAATDVGMSASYHIGGVLQRQDVVTPFIFTTTWDNGTDLASLDSEKYTSYTVSQSMRTGTQYVAYGTVQYDTLGAAQAAGVDLGVFDTIKEGSFIEPMALVIVKEGQTDIQSIVDVRAGKIATTIDAIAGQTIPSPKNGEVMSYNGTQWISTTPTSNAGQNVSYFLGNNIISGDNYDLTTSPAGGSEVVVQQTANSGDSPKFIERYISDALGGDVIDAGVWTFKTYASVSANAGTTNIVARINKSVLKAGTLSTTGTGQTRTFTATEAGTFVAGDASASILDSTLIETPTETFWITNYISDTVVEAITDGVGYVNETGVTFNNYYKLFQNTVAENVTGSTASLYDTTSIQSTAFPIDPEDKLLVAYFLEVSSGNNKTVSLYKNGTEHYTHFDTPLVLRHNDLAGLNEGDYKHLTEVFHTALTSGILDASALHNHNAQYLNKTNTATFTPTADYQPATKKYVDDNAGGGSSATQSTVVAGEDVGAGDALYINSTDGEVYLTDASDSNKTNFVGFADNTALEGENVTLNTAGVDGNQSGLIIGEEYYLENALTITSTTPTNAANFGRVTSNIKQSQRITTLSSINVIGLSAFLRKVGTPTDDAVIRIETDNAGEPSGTLVNANAIYSLSGVSVPTTYPPVATDLTGTAFDLTSGIYHIVYERSGALDSSNYYNIGYVDNLEGVADREYYQIVSGTTWTSSATTRCLSLSLLSTAGGISTTGTVKVGKAISATELEIYTGGGGVNETFNINASGGHALTTTTTIVALNTAVLDTGNNFNTSTYQYTCPSDGNYQFNLWFSIQSVNSGDEIYISIYVNGSGGNRLQTTMGGAKGTLSGSVTLPLLLGDTIEIRANNQTASRGFLTAGSSSTLSGYKLN